MIKSLILALMLTSTAATASLVAVIDSGVDVDHPALSNQIWTNSADSFTNNKDDDNNGYVDDYYGWNYVSNNNLVIDIEHAERFNDDVEKFFELQYIMYLYNKGINKFSQEMLDWYYGVLFPNSGPMNPVIAENGGFFGGYSHGTHVAGIVAKNNPQLEILSVKIMGTESKLHVNADLPKEENGDDEKVVVLPDAQLEQYKVQLASMAKNQSQKFIKIADYLKGHKVRVANASFGTGFLMTLNWLKSALQGVDEEQIAQLTYHFQSELVKNNKAAFERSPNTLIVAAAGNDNTDIDALPDSPASIVSDNLITVAATWDRNEIADFSCYGATKVHVAAPGVGIRSAAPGGNYVYMNGTSQAAPYVSNVASQIIDTNPELTSKQVKDILIGTVDKKSWLIGKVSSAGIVNLERAVFAADLMIEYDYSLEEALYESRMLVEDEPEANHAKSLFASQPKLNLPAINLVSKRPSTIIFK